MPRTRTHRRRLRTNRVKVLIPTLKLSPCFFLLQSLKALFGFRDKLPKPILDPRFRCVAQNSTHSYYPMAQPNFFGFKIHRRLLTPSD